VHLTVLKLLETLRNGNSDVLLEFRTREGLDGAINEEDTVEPERRRDEDMVPPSD